ncbi:RNA-binding domain-containing protein [Aliivibrio fischeri]|uniref:RNA-binding domain-containing protein n=1 Tax=Aliivibrio fischeri TaxID=668 RepID=UPI000908233C|nr:RNA-binding domain-containing protein [Aliivibrio fischeri]
MNAYEFIKKVLVNTDNQLEPLLKATKYEETEWLEFKANIEPIEKSKVESKQLAWNIFKAIVSLSNSVGGAVILGLTDSGQPVDILKSYGLDKDKYARAVLDKILSPANETWSDYDKKKQQIKYQLCSQEDLNTAIKFELKWAYIDEKPLLVVLVEPTTNATIIQASNSKDLILFHRSSGDIGRVQKKLYSETDALAFCNRNLNKHGDMFNSLLSQLTNLKTLGLQQRVKKHNDFIASEWSSTEECIDLSVSVALPIKEKDEFPLWHSTNGVKIKKIQGRIPFSQASLKTNRYIITGDPGSGKSTLLKSAFISATKRFSDSVNLYADMKFYTSAGLMYLLCQGSNEFTTTDLTPLLNSGKVSIYIDSLNECPAECYEAALREITTHIRQFPNLNIFISSRNNEHIDSFKIPKLTTLPLNDSQAESLVGDSLTSKLGLLNTLSKKPGFELIKTSPILLKIAKWLHDESHDVPHGIARTYQAFFKSYYLREHEKLAKVGNVESATYNATVEILAQLAFHMRVHGIFTCDMNFIRGCLEESSLDLNPIEILSSLKSGLIYEISKAGEFSFSHETFQEYFCAEYLTTYQDLQLSGNLNRKWDLPIVFTFELAKTPSLNFIKSAWDISPFITAAACQDIAVLRQLENSNTSNLWEIAFLKLLRGEPYEHELESLAIISRLPPKYGLPERLKHVLQMNYFWYALTTYEDGFTKLNNIEASIKSGSLWIEILSLIGSKTALLFKELNTIHTSLAGLTEHPEEDDLKLAKIPELCSLKNKKIINSSIFNQYWKEALSLCDGIELTINTLLVYREKDIRSVNFTSKQSSTLKNVANDERLSLRILNKIITDNLIEKETIENDETRINDIINRASIMNLVRFSKKGIIDRKNLSRYQVGQIKSKIASIHDFREITKSGLLNKHDFESGFEQRLSSKHSNTVSSGELSDTFTYVSYKRELDMQKEHIRLLNISKLSPEEQTLKELSQQSEQEPNWNPSSEFHRKLINQVTQSDNWDTKLKVQLLDTADQFFRKYASKKKRKEFLAIIKSKKEMI